jgi:uncharacterized delta-60 repeat protein
MHAWRTKDLRKRGDRFIASALAICVGGAMLLAATGAIASSGDLDPTFSGDGRATTDIATFGDTAKGVALQDDGKIVVAGSGNDGTNWNFEVVRYKSDGALDTTFSGDGKQTTNLGGDAFAQDVAIQSDGKIVVAGYVDPNNFALVRYNTDGTPDSGFDGDGIVTTSIGSGDDEAFGVAIQSDGKIVAAGFSNNGTNNDFALIRYTTAGAPDPDFDGDGIVTTPIGSGSDAALDVAVGSDGKIVAAGSSSNGTTTDFAVVRYTSAGAPDSSFDGDGIATRSIGPGNDFAFGVAVQNNGKVVVSGVNSNAGVENWALARFTNAGAPDTTFSSDGRLITVMSSAPNGGGRANDVAIQPDGRIVAAGFTQVTATSDDFALARYKADGSLDPSFSTDGKATVPSTANNDHAEGVALQSDGKIVLAGNDTFDQFAVARLQGLSDESPAVVRGNVWYLDFNGDGISDRSFAFGRSTDTKVKGDWNADGIDTAGLVRGNVWYLDNNNDGHAEKSFGFGRIDDVKVVGDWNGDGFDTPGVVRGGDWFLDNGFDGHADVVFHYGRPTDRPIVGDWNGDGKDTAGVTRGGAWLLDNANDGSGSDLQCSFGASSDAKIAGDWNGDAKDGVGVVRDGIFYLNDGCDSLYEHSIAFGRKTDTPLVGRWRG